LHRLPFRNDHRATGQDRAGWNDLLEWMVADMEVGEMHPEDREHILDYLATYYNEDQPYNPLTQ
jgi:cytochrome c